jgi:hypothetical protein
MRDDEERHARTRALADDEQPSAWRQGDSSLTFIRERADV